MILVGLGYGNMKFDTCKQIAEQIAVTLCPYPDKPVKPQPVLVRCLGVYTCLPT